MGGRASRKTYRWPFLRQNVPPALHVGAPELLPLPPSKPWRLARMTTGHNAIEKSYLKAGECTGAGRHQLRRRCCREAARYYALRIPEGKSSTIDQSLYAYPLPTEDHRNQARLSHQILNSCFSMLCTWWRARGGPCCDSSWLVICKTGGSLGGNKIPQVPAELGFDVVSWSAKSTCDSAHAWTDHVMYICRI